MYYSKNGATQLTIPKNYAGNAFYTDEKSEQSASKSAPDKTEFLFPDSEKVEAVEEKTDKNNILASLVSDISVEDLLLVGLIFVIYQSDPKDPTLIILLILLLVK